MKAWSQDCFFALIYDFKKITALKVEMFQIFQNNS